MNKREMLFVAAVLCFAITTGVQADVRICRSGGVDIWADNGGTYPASSALQTCVNDATVAAINLEPGLYVIDTPVIVRRPLTIRTAGLAYETRNCQQLPAGQCATLIASSNPAHCINSGNCGGRLATDGMLQAKGTTRVIFDHLILDGNRGNRQYTQAKTNCQNGLNRWGFNSAMGSCGGTSSAERCEFTYNYTHHALCGTGLEFSGDYGRIQGNAAFDNGVPLPTRRLWSDGLTIVRNNNGIVNDNHLVNNTDVALIVGAGRNTQVQSNWIQQVHVYAFAALSLDNFGGTQTGDFTNATVRYNTIQCNGLLCGFGINLGPDAWSSVNQPNIVGGLVTQNNVSGARVLINFGGAGTPLYRTTVTNNTLSGAPTYDLPVAPGSSCYASANVLQNLPNNNSTGICGNAANVDGIPTSANCNLSCFNY